ncbi:protein phosphatase 1G-like isoform X3 [Asterias amurensis]|uniref:protein phosphatase 1G-like isoform X3 n=1 Tax=Asterias amurensis TaxID=7602 RepID=UPI003AB304CB
MGAYLSEPNVECVSDDGGIEKFRYGSSAMQGWRLGMEDGHNCIPEVDNDTAMFAVYDGHGGAEVALYCSKHLPDYIKDEPAYKEGNMEKAMQDAFMRIDAVLREPSAIEELKHLAGMEHSADEADVEEASALQEEANLPLGELLARYSYNPTKTRTLRKKLDKNELLSPMVRKKPPIFGEENTEGADKEANGEERNGSIPLRLEEETKDEEVISGSEDKGQGDGATTKEGGVSKVETGNGDSAEESKENSKCNGAGDAGKKPTNGTIDLVKEDLDDEEEDEEEDEDEESESEEDEEEEEEEGGDDDAEDDQQDVFGQKEEQPGSDSGCTAVVALIQGKRIIVANAGDSRCVLSKAGIAVDLSIDHKPEDDIEITRIEKAGGKVTPDGRVNGGLNLSRAIGDHCYKCNTDLPPEEQMISAFPDIQTAELTKENDIMVIACDGIWNVMTSQEVIDFVRVRIENQTKDDKSCKLSEICEELFRVCLAPDTSGDGTGCDNMTCVIVQFNHNSSDQTLTGRAKRKASDTEASTGEDNDSKRPKV